MKKATLHLIAVLTAVLLFSFNVKAQSTNSNTEQEEISRETLSPILADPANGLTIDGNLADWSFINSQVFYVAEEFFEKERVNFSFRYDNEALYFAAKVHDISPLMNSNHFTGRFWEGDSIQLRLYTKLNSNNVPARRRGITSQDKQVVHANFYHQHTTNKSFIFLHYSVNFIESVPKPEGAEVAFKKFDNNKGYNVEAKLPWQTLNVPIPPKDGDTIRALVEVNFSDFLGQKRVRRASGAYIKNPGDFGFFGGNKWGFLKFGSKESTKRMYPDAKKLASLMQSEKGLRIPVKFPFEGCATINIKDANGEIIREIVLDKPQPAGAEYDFVWDGKNNAGQNVSLGKYTHEVLFYKPIKALYKGSTCSSGSPVYGTADGKGEWGGDHSNPLAVSIDDKGMTLLWPIAELGKAIVRLDNNDKVLWRYTPFFDAMGNFYTMTSDGDYVYLTYETPKTHPKVLRLNANTGEPEFFIKDTKAVDLPVTDVKRVHMPEESRATSYDLIASGMAVDNKYLYISISPANQILVLDKKTASEVKRISIPSPRGLAIGKTGKLYAISFPETGKGSIYEINEEANQITTASLSSPWNIAVRSDGVIAVTDLGESQQVKLFTPKGELLNTYGKQGGRPVSGKYVAGDYLLPSGIAADNTGNLVVVESALPSVISRINTNGKIEKQWFGPGNYAHAVWPDARDPFLIFSLLPGGMLRSTLEVATKKWQPENYWSFTSARRKKEHKKGNHSISFDTFKGDYFQDFLGDIAYPQTMVIDGHQYMSSDSSNHPIVRIDGNELIPMATCFARDGKVYIAHDDNSNEQIDTTEIIEVTNIPSIKDKRPHMMLNKHTGSHTLSPYSGNWYIAGRKKIYKIPLKSSKQGRLVFDHTKATVFINDITRGERKRLGSSHRSGILGMREDKQENLYVLYTYSGRSPGIGHSSDITDVFIAKFDKSGKRIWTAGRKASSFAKAGEVYNPWIMAGILNDKFIAFSDETGGIIHFYDLDGFYRGKIFKDYARGDSSPGPYLFHGENFSGRVQYFPELNKYMAYQGMTDSRVFELNNMDSKTQLVTGKTSLTKHYSNEKKKREDTAVITKITKALDLNSDDKEWNSLKHITVQSTAKLKMAVTNQELFVEFNVKDKSPLKNVESDPTMAFKGGDAVDLYFGKAVKRKTEKPIIDDTRILISPYKSSVRITGMKRMTSGEKKETTYYNPGGYKREFEFVGEIKDAKAVAIKTSNGYRIRARIPLSFFTGLSFAPNSQLKFDADILQSDAAGQRTTNRIFWHASGNSALTMTQDIPTECDLYPTYWGKAVTK